MKIANATPIFKVGNSADLSIYRVIFVLPCFSKSHGLLVNNPLYKHVSNLKILYPKQFGFQRGHSTDHTSLQFGNSIFSLMAGKKQTAKLSNALFHRDPI